MAKVIHRLESAYISSDSNPSPPQQFFIQESSTPVRVVPDLGERLVHPENNYENLSLDADEVVRSPCLGGTFDVLGWSILGLFHSWRGPLSKPRRKSVLRWYVLSLFYSWTARP